MVSFALGICLGWAALARFLRGRDVRALATFGLLGRLAQAAGVTLLCGLALLGASLLGMRLGVLALGLCGLALVLAAASLWLAAGLRPREVRALPGEGARFGAVEGMRRVPGGVALLIGGEEVAVPGAVSGELGPHALRGAARRLPPLLVLGDGTVWVRARWGEGQAGGRRYAPLSPYLTAWLSAPR